MAPSAWVRPRWRYFPNTSWFTSCSETELTMSPARWRLKSPQSLFRTSTHHTMVTQGSISWSWMDDSHPFQSMSIGRTIPEIRLFQTLTLKLQGQGHGCGQRAYSWPSILFLLVSHQSDQQFLRYSYFEIWPRKIKGQGLFLSHQLDQPFLRYGQ